MTKTFYMRMLILIVSVCFASCQPIKVSQTYCTPHFTKGNQFEGSISAGSSGLNGYLTYSPIKYFSAQVSGFTFPGADYTNSYEAGAGFYFPYKKYVFAVNGGYGQLDCDWTLRSIFGHSGYTLNKLEYFSEHTFIHAYFSHKKDSTNKFYNGFSFKLSDFSDHYIKGSADANSSTGFQNLKNKNYHSQSYEFTYFQKMRIANHLYFSLNSGFRYVNFYPTIDAQKIVILLRIGLVFKL